MAVDISDVNASILTFLNGGYSTTPVLWPGRTWDTDDMEMWVEPYVTEYDQTHPRQTGKVEGRVILNVFRKLPLAESSSSNAYSGLVTATELSDLFSHQSADVKDYVTGDGTTSTGAVSFGRASMANLGRDRSLEQYSLSIPYSAT